MLLTAQAASAAPEHTPSVLMPILRSLEAMLWLTKRLRVSFRS